MFQAPKSAPIYKPRCVQVCSCQSRRAKRLPTFRDRRNQNLLDIESPWVRNREGFGTRCADHCFSSATSTWLSWDLTTGNNETLLGVIREQGEWPLRPKGARSMASNKEGSREQGKHNLWAGSTKIWKRKQGAANNWEMEQGAREIIREQDEKLKKEQGAKRNEKGAVKFF